MVTALSLSHGHNCCLSVTACEDQGSALRALAGIERNQRNITTVLPESVHFFVPSYNDSIPLLCYIKVILSYFELIYF